MFKYLNVLGKNEEPIHLQPNSRVHVRVFLLTMIKFNIQQKTLLRLISTNNKKGKNGS
jgi:hypothetical protein